MFEDFEFDGTIDKVWFAAQLLILFFLIIYLILMWRTYKKAEIDSQKAIYKGFAQFMLLNVLNQSYFLLHTAVNRSGGELLPRYIGIGGDGYILIMLLAFGLAFGFLMKPIEIHLQQRKHAWVSLMDFVGVLLLLIPFIGAIFSGYPAEEYWTTLSYPGLGILGIGFLFSLFSSFYFYLKLGISSSGTLRKKGFFIGIGMILLYFGVLVGTNFDGWVAMILGPFPMVIGCILILRGHQLDLSA